MYNNFTFCKIQGHFNNSSRFHFSETISNCNITIYRKREEINNSRIFWGIQFK